MARATLEVITALRVTARRLRIGAPYRWTHMGACNCGHLAQTITRRSRVEIHSYAIQREGEWGDQVVHYCPTSGFPMDQIVGAMIDFGFNSGDLARLEKLDDPRILRRIPRERRPLNFRDRDDVVLYMETWASMLEEKLDSSSESQVAEHSSGAEAVPERLAS
ncbi:MAG: hypothetical protein AAGD01_13610 [Acidobacteriota bacterium]